MVDKLKIESRFAEFDNYNDFYEFTGSILNYLKKHYVLICVNHILN